MNFILPKNSKDNTYNDNEYNDNTYNDNTYHGQESGKQDGPRQEEMQNTYHISYLSILICLSICSARRETGSPTLDRHIYIFIYLATYLSLCSARRETGSPTFG